MKRILRHTFINLLSLYLVGRIDNGFTVGGDVSVFIYAGILLTVINMFAKPILKIMFLPINLITLGFFSWVINIIALYILTLIVPQISIGRWQFPGFYHPWVSLPAFTLSPWLNFVFVSLMLAFFSRFFHWLHK